MMILPISVCSCLLIILFSTTNAFYMQMPVNYSQLRVHYIYILNIRRKLEYILHRLSKNTQI